ncbi:hypothetical protein BS50DRAFT_197225 [Corynespora cassiicola Philippines]|uniref:Uncharacterized protein n=1 Tax=Corynespora cassiicola Philippines TaxID=1448308 RepID=A0A2T2N5L2_CORCC|nr:hypothetical protein BS50DRAFT_197225 [Corynespora cassiicola Philippines]
MGERRRCWGTCWRGWERQEGQRLGGRETYTEWLLAVYLPVCLSVYGPRPDGRRGTWTDPRVSLWRRARHATALWLWRCRLPSAIFPSLLVSSAVGEITRGSSRFSQLLQRRCLLPTASTPLPSSLPLALARSLLLSLSPSRTTRGRRRILAIPDPRAPRSGLVAID